MKELICGIREKTRLSQTEFGAQLGVSFSTVNRWENGKVIPTKMAQLQLFEIAKKYQVNIADMVFARIEKEIAKIELDKGRKLLFHGSKSGIEGNIRPISRDRCDFGSGFYMGNIPEQPLTLICDYDTSRFYVVSIQMENLSSLDIQTNLEWAMLVAFHRGRMEEIRDTKFYHKYETYFSDTDVIIGSIADDRMFYVLDNFFQGNITDQALLNSLSALQLGKQYVAITQKACDQIKIEKEIELSILERKCLREVAEQNRKQGIMQANEICRMHRREGLYFDELLEREC